MKRTKMKVDTLVGMAAAYNPRSISPEALERLKASLQHFGLVQPIIVNEATQVIVGGHQRVKAMREMGVSEADVILVNLEDLDEKVLNVALNSKALTGEFDLPKLEDLVGDIMRDEEDLAKELGLDLLATIDFGDADTDDSGNAADVPTKAPTVKFKITIPVDADASLIEDVRAAVQQLVDDHWSEHGIQVG